MQLRLKLTSQQSTTLLVAEYQRDRTQAHIEKKTIRKLIEQVTEIIMVRLKVD